jgi:hypothetical protein
MILLAEKDGVKTGCPEEIVATDNAQHSRKEARLGAMKGFGGENHVGLDACRERKNAELGFRQDRDR